MIHSLLCAVVCHLRKEQDSEGPDFWPAQVSHEKSQLEPCYLSLGALMVEAIMDFKAQVHAAR